MCDKHIKNFKVLPIKFSSASTSHHDLFFKEHSTRQKSLDKPADRTLFVLNIPPYATEKSIKNVFSKAGVVEKVTFNYADTLDNNILNVNNKIGFKNAYVVFGKPIGLLKSMKLTSLEPLSSSDNPILCGLKKWAKEYNSSIYDPKELQATVNKSMKKFDEEIKDKEKQEQQNTKMDNDGWTLVTKQGRNQGLARKKSVENKIKEKIEKSKKKKELKNFYTFQIRQSKMKHLANLRQKFEEDKKKIDSLKQARKFKPY